MFKIHIKADFRGSDTRSIEGFIRALVEQTSGRPVARTTYHGVLRSRIEDLREQLSRNSE